MFRIVSLPTTNQANDKDWARATKGVKISAYVGAQPVANIESETTFTQQDFEDALKKVSRKIKK